MHCKDAVRTEQTSGLPHRPLQWRIHLSFLWDPLGTQNVLCKLGKWSVPYKAVKKKQQRHLLPQRTTSQMLIKARNQTIFFF